MRTHISRLVVDHSLVEAGSLRVESKHHLQRREGRVSPHTYRCVKAGHTGSNTQSTHTAHTGKYSKVLSAYSLVQPIFLYAHSTPNFPIGAGA